MVGCRYWAKCQVWPLRACDLPRMVAEMTPMRYVLPAGAGCSAAAPTRVPAAAVPGRVNRARRVRKGESDIGSLTAEPLDFKAHAVVAVTRPCGRESPVILPCCRD